MRNFMFAATIILFGCGGDKFTVGNETNGNSGGTAISAGTGGEAGHNATGGHDAHAGSGQGGFSAGKGGSAGSGDGGQGGSAVATGGTAGDNQGGTGGSQAAGGGSSGGKGGSNNQGGAGSSSGGSSGEGGTQNSGGSAGNAAGSGGSAGSAGDIGGEGGNMAGSGGSPGGTGGAAGTGGNASVCDTATVVFNNMPCYEYGIFRAGSFLPSPDSSPQSTCQTGVTCNNPQDGDFDILWVSELDNQGKLLRVAKPPMKYTAHCTAFTASAPPSQDQLKPILLTDGWVDPVTATQGDAVMLSAPTCGGSSVVYALKY